MADVIDLLLTLIMFTTENTEPELHLWGCRAATGSVASDEQLVRRRYIVENYIYLTERIRKVRAQPQDFVFYL